MEREDSSTDCGTDASNDAGLFAKLAAKGARRKYRKDTILIEERDQGDQVFAILSGRVKVYSVDENGREFTYLILGAGETFGEMSLDGGPRSASVMTLEACECAVLGRTEMREFLLDHPEFTFDLLVTVIRRAREATRAARGLALGDVYSRLTAFLDNNARPGPDGERRMEEVLTQADIASRIGSSREMVSRIMKDLESGGYLTSRDRRLVLLRKLPERW